MLTEQDEINLEFAMDVLRKAAKKKGIRGSKIRGLVGWVGRVGFDECVAKLSTVKGVSDPKLVCGALKGEARRTGQLSRKHMGRIEKKKKTKKK